MFFVKGILIGLLFGLPAGAIGALTIQRTLSGGFRIGFLTGIGSTAADLCYAAVGAFGLNYISDFLSAYQQIISLIGAVFISLLALSCFRRTALPDRESRSERKASVRAVRAFLSSFVTAIMNPVTIASFLVAFSTFGINRKLSVLEGIALLMGIAAGTTCWWLALAFGTAAFGKRITDKTYRLINRGLGIVMLLCTAVIVIRALQV